MSAVPLYLRQNVQVEPLLDSWYAWPHLIPPATAARNVTERHLKIMDSYIAAPSVHAAAVKNPKMLGGPFIDYKGDRVDEIVALRDRTKTERSNLIQLSAAIQTLDNMLRTNAKGFSLHPLYAQVPPILKGYVELVYDLNNNASFRLLEPLLYRSMYFDRSAQSVALSIIDGDDRPFVLSTPRLPSDGTISLARAFDDRFIDWLFQLKQSPEEWSRIREGFDLPEQQSELLRSLFTEESPAPYQKYSGKGLRWRYFGHACILLESANVSMLFDPVLSYTYDTDLARYTYADLPDEIDFVLITHNHQDHILMETLLQIRHKVKTFIVPFSSGGALQDPSVKLLLEATGCKNVVEMRPMECLRFESGSVTALPFLGEHADLDVQSKLGYLIRMGNHSLLFLADSCNIEPMLYHHLREEIGEVDAMFLGMECDGAPLSWLYGPLLTRPLDRAMDGSRRLAGSNYQQALDIVDRFACKEVYVYAMGQEPWLNYVMSIKYTEQSRPIVDSNNLIRDCKGRGLCAERLFGEKEILLEE